MNAIAPAATLQGSNVNWVCGLSFLPYISLNVESKFLFLNIGN